MHRSNPLTDQNHTLTDLDTLRVAAAALLNRIDHITTHDFERGGERKEREALRKVLAHLAQKWGRAEHQRH